MPNEKIVNRENLKAFRQALDTKYQEKLVSGTNIKTLNGTTLLGSGNYEFDSAFNELSTNALQNKVIAKEVREINYELAVIREALFEVVLDESDYTVNFTTLYAIPDMIDNHRIVYSETALKKIDGNSVVMNQWVADNKKDFTSSTTDTRANFQFNIQFYSSGTGYVNKITQNITTTGFKSFIVSNTTSTAYSDIILKHNGSSGDILILDLTKRVFPNTIYWIGFLANGIDVSTSGGLILNNISVINLTQMFGTGNEPTTTDDARVQWLISQGYIAYNTGSLLNSNVSGLKLVGLNQWDEQWEVGSLNYSTGGIDNADTTRIRSKNYIPVISGTKLYLNSTGRISLFAYDKNFNYIGYGASTGLTNSDFNDSGTITNNVPNNVAYIKFIMASSYGTTYNNDICINISNATLNGTYKPYTTSTISVPQTELISAGTVHNNIQVVEGDIVEGEKLYNLVKNENVGSLDLGTLEWSYSSDINIFVVSQSNTLVKVDVKNAICQKYFFNGNANASSQTNMSNNLSDKQMCSYSNPANQGRFVVKDSSYTDAATFKTAMNGVILNYELATQTQTVIATGLHYSEVSSLIEQGGTIEMINTGTPTNTTTTFVVKKATGE